MRIFRREASKQEIPPVQESGGSRDRMPPEEPVSEDRPAAVRAGQAGEEQKMSDLGFTKETIISDILEKNPNVYPILISAGMHCISCPASQGESLEEAAWVHGIDADALMEYIEEELAYMGQQ